MYLYYEYMYLVSQYLMPLSVVALFILNIPIGLHLWKIIAIVFTYLLYFGTMNTHADASVHVEIYYKTRLKVSLCSSPSTSG